MDKLIKPEYFTTWKSMLDVDLGEAFSEIQQRVLDPHSFTFYTSVSVMSSSKIEGEQLELDSYVKHKLLNIEYLPELTEKPNDLFRAYLFANENRLTPKNFLEAHQLAATNLLPKNQQGALRQTEMLVLDHKTGRIQYEAAQHTILQEHYDKLWKEIQALLKKDLSIDEVFYNAAFIHLAFVNIHPFGDGNGRISRLLEKWFLAEKLGDRAWYIQSEKYYYKQVNTYYKNLARLGMFYERLEYEKSIPFLLMLPQSLIFED
jgi:Fic family protein